MQKTWTDLLGPWTSDTKVDGPYIVREEEPNHYRVLWSFKDRHSLDHHRDALRCYEAWKCGG